MSNNYQEAVSDAVTILEGYVNPLDCVEAAQNVVQTLDRNGLITPDQVTRGKKFVIQRPKPFSEWDSWIVTNYAPENLEHLRNTYTETRFEVVTVLDMPANPSRDEQLIEKARAFLENNFETEDDAQALIYDLASALEEAGSNEDH